MQRKAMKPGRGFSRLFVLLVVAVVPARAERFPGAAQDEPILETQAADFPSEPKERIWSVAYAADGKTLATAAGAEKGGGALRLFDVARRVETLRVESPCGIRGVAFGFDGTTIATAERDRTVKLRDAGDGRVRHVLKGFPGA